MAAITPASHAAYRDILRIARRCGASADEAHDLAQDVVVIALANGIADWSSPGRRSWLHGVLRKRAAFVVRGDKRRRRRERLPDGPGEAGDAWGWRPEFLASLPHSLRAVAALASADLCAAEIRWLLGISDTALRQRLSALRRAVRAQAESPTLPAPAPPTFGIHRSRLLADLRRQPGAALATQDPDGHPIFLRIGPHRSSGSATGG
ncbi:MAG TPA: transcriptional regulator [Polyangia bacterium]